MRFVKYQGLGNDFILVDRLSGDGPVSAEEAKRLCDRHRGVGADGVLTVLPSKVAAARMHIRNADGSTAQMCGNGLRCVASWLAVSRGLGGAKRVAEDLDIETDAGVRRCRLVPRGEGRGEIEADMGPPELEAGRIPVAAGPGRFIRQPIEIESRGHFATAVSMGNPHVVLFDAPLERIRSLGPALERHALFPERTNVELAEVVGGGLTVAVWERGVGMTQACGTGACAAMVAAVLEGRLPPGEERPVRLAGGVLQVRVLSDLSRVFLRGPAVRVFEGEVDLPALVEE